MNVISHLKTILNHKRLVRKYCFRVGLYYQGLTHDMSKYSPTEFFVGCKYYLGDRSPNNAERLDKGYSAAWLHHKGRNKHHLEYWIDYEPTSGLMTGMKMPVKYVVEMFIDRMSASKNYGGENYTNRSALEYYEIGKEHYMLHQETKDLLEKLLIRLAEEGEEATFSYIKSQVLNQKEEGTRNDQRKKNTV